MCWCDQRSNGNQGHSYCMYASAQVKKECYNSDESYTPDSDVSVESDTEKKRKQVTNYSGVPLPTNIEVIRPCEKITDTASYTWPWMS